MSDIVERLRSFSEADAYEAPWTFGQHVQEAAATITELRKEVERLTALVVEERLENLWNAYNTGHERDGQWTHAFMSDGEWLASEIGMDPTQGWYDAAEVKRLIPEAAARAALQGETK